MYLVFVWWLCQRLPRIMEGSRGFNVTKLNAFLTIPLFRYHMYCMPALQLLMWNLSKNLFNFYTGFKDLIFHHSEMFILISQPSICGSFCFLNGITFQNIMYSYDQILSVLQFDVASILQHLNPSQVWPGLSLQPSHSVSWPCPLSFPQCILARPSSFPQYCLSLSSLHQLPSLFPFPAHQQPSLFSPFSLLRQSDWLYVLEDTQPSLRSCWKLY